MKAQELLTHAECSICHRKVGQTGMPSFWTLQVERHGIKLDAVRRHDGLAMMMSSPVLAQVLGPDEEMTLPLMDPVELTICEICMVEKFPLIMSAAWKE